jgi:2,4-dienoyl-CoA reductase-like NADH-dependent reductase (Old Yellow Enzyme family)
MSLLFAPGAIGNVEIKNRLVRAPTFEGLADESGRVTDELVSVYRRLAEGDVGLILSGFMYVHRMGQVMRRQVGISSDDAVAGLSRLAEVVHASGGRIAFEMSHGGRQASAALIGRRPYGPSAVHRDPTSFIKPAAMTQQDIREVVDSFVAATRRAVAAGGDIVYIHAAGGDLLNQFLSPYFNCRTDEWGGSVDNRFRILRTIIEGARDAVGDLPILVKMNAQDYTPEPGVTPELAREYAARLSEMGVSALELSSGVKLYCFMNCWRGEVPIKEVLAALPAWKRPIGLVKMKRWASGKYRLVEGWNLDNLRAVKPAAGRMALLLVGGMRRVEHMEAVLERGEADFICLCRPFIRQPDLVRKFKGGAKQATCRSCNKCFAAGINNLPVRCYQGGIPAIS